jgi:hypothetical protein
MIKTKKIIFMKNDFQIKLDNLLIEIEACNTFDDKLFKWAEFAVSYCNKVAKTQVDRAFYAFQSKPIKSPEVLILGLNPYGNCNYQSQVGNEKWELKESNEMIPAVFIQQNQWYTGGKYADKKWNILEKLNKTIEVQPEFHLLFENMVYMNILYFNSIDFSEFKRCSKNWKEVYENCIALSSLLIFEIIKPKKILCLGIENCFIPLIVGKPEEIIRKALYKFEMNGYKIYGMTHPSARTSNLLREQIGWHLYADWFEKPIFESLGKKLQIIGIILSKIATKYNLELNLDINKLNNQFGFFKFYHKNVTDVSFYFEFQKPFLSDLWYGVNYPNKKLFKFKNSATICESPYTNWMTLSEGFNHEDFERYFDNLVKKFIQNYKDQSIVTV